MARSARIWALRAAAMLFAGLVGFVVLDHATFMVVRGTELPDRLGHEGRDFLRGDEACRKASPGGLPYDARPAFDITVLFGRDIPVWSDDRGAEVATELYAEVEPDCFVGYGLSGGP